MDDMKIFQATVDPCVLIKRNNDQHSGIIILEVDDSMDLGTKTFLRQEEEASHRCKSRPHKKLTTTPTVCNVSHIWRSPDGSVHMYQSGKIPLLHFPTTEQEFNSQREKAQYRAMNARPDITESVHLIAPGNYPVSDAKFTILKNTIRQMHETKETGLTCQSLDLTTLRLTLITDESFVNARNDESQLGYLILMSDDIAQSKIVHYSSVRCRTVTRSIMASEIHAMVLGVDQAFPHEAHNREDSWPQHRASRVRRQKNRIRYHSEGW